MKPDAIRSRQPSAVWMEGLSLAEFGEPPWAGPLLVSAAAPPSACDAVVVGAGVTGLAAAIRLAEQKIDVTVIDRCVGGGATARSGGIILGETLVGEAPGFDSCDRTLRDWIERERIACDATWCGCLELSRKPALEAPETGWFDHGVLRVAACVPGGLLDPRKLLSGLLEASMRRGIRVVAGVAVERVESDGGLLQITGGGSVVKARQAIMAVDALSWSRTFDPWEQRTITVALQTHAAAGLAEEIGLHEPFYTREMPLLWGRPMPEGSLLFGRELIAWPPPARPDDVRTLLAAAGDRLIGRVRGLHPCLADIGVRRLWAGPTARTGPGVPALIEDPSVDGVIWAGGYGGHGLAQAFTLGRAAADLAAQRLAGSATKV